MTDVPEGYGVIRNIGWMTDDETKKEVFRAWVDFPNGPPPIQYSVIFQQIPIQIVPAPRPNEETSPHD